MRFTLMLAHPPTPGSGAKPDTRAN